MLTLLAQRMRRDRVQVPLWIVGSAALALATYAGISETYGTAQDRAALLATAIANPVVLLFRGLPSGADEGAFAAFLILPFLSFLAALMSSFLAVRHTRAEEESGRAELTASTPAGRMRPLLATLVHGLVADIVFAVAVALAFLASGLPPAGAWLTGLAAGAVGVVFLGFGVLAAQLFPTSRAANSAGVWTIVLTFLIAGIGNALGTPDADLTRVESSWLTWLSPFGWAENTRPFADDAVWPIVLCLTAGVLFAAGGAAVQSVRDVGAGVLAERVGRPGARAPGAPWHPRMLWCGG